MIKIYSYFFLIALISCTKTSDTPEFKTCVANGRKYYKAIGEEKYAKNTGIIESKCYKQENNWFINKLIDKK